MGLLQNIGLLNAEPTSYLGGAAISCIDLAHFNRHGTELNIYMTVDAGMDKKGGVPYGYSHPYQIVMPMKDGGMSTAGTIEGAGEVTLNLFKGINIASGSPRIVGSGSIVSNVFLGYYMTALLEGEGSCDPSLSGSVRLIAELVGDGSLDAPLGQLSGLAAILDGLSSIDATIEMPIGLAAGISGEGDLVSSMFGVTYLLALIEGESDLVSEMGSMAQLSSSLEGDGDLVDSSLKCIAWCVSEILGLGEVSGDSNLRGDCSMSTTITSAGELVTAQSCAAAVWSALASLYNEPGTMGEKMNDAGSAGDPWGTDLVAGGYVDDQAGNIVLNRLLTTLKFLGLK